MLSCDLHDYLEIACLYHYQLQVILQSGQVYEGQAIDIVLNSAGNEKEEYLHIDVDKQRTSIKVSDIKSIEAKNDHAKFTKVNFS